MERFLMSKHTYRKIKELNEESNHLPVITNIEFKLKICAVLNVG